MTSIAYDYQIFSYQRYGGISRYFCELLSKVDQIDNFEVSIYAGLYQNKFISNYHDVSIKGYPISYIPIPKSREFFTAINYQLTKLALKVDPPDIIHETFYSLQSAAPKESKIVLTVHDMIHEKFSSSLDPQQTFAKVKAAAIKRADRIICVSENTKKDLLEILNIDSEKVFTVHLGDSILTPASNNINRLVADPYLLYVGDRSASYKNFQRMLEAYISSKQLRDNFKIVCFGLSPFSDSEIDTISHLGININDVLHYTGEDSILANLYTHAEALIYPSLYEGFGIPPLEAMSFDCPVVCSNISSIPEVVGEAGEYFNPYEVDSMAEAIEKVVFSSTRREHLKNAGQERLKLFSWDRCAQETSLVYQSLL